MGCTTSSLENLPIVTLCHDRCNLLHQALHHSYALADAHVAYLLSLNYLGPTLFTFFQYNVDDLQQKFDDGGGDSRSRDGKCKRDCKFDSSSSSSSEEEYYYGGNGTTPSPPGPVTSTWDLLNNLFEPFDRSYEFGEVRSDEFVSKEVVEENRPVKTEKKTDLPKPESNSPSLIEVMAEIKCLFEKAALEGFQVLKVLDTVNFCCSQKNDPVYHRDSAKMLREITPSLLHSIEKIGSVNHSSEASSNLSSTLMKLHIWEKKLYNEVKTEEKLRLMFKKINGNKVKSTPAILNALSSEINVSIQVISKISTAINTLRDEELWPQIKELCYKLHEMWKAMLECHRNQSKALIGAKILNTIDSITTFKIAHLEATMQLKTELLGWCRNFTNLIGTHTSFFKALSAWLRKCLPPDSNVDKFPMFAFCDQWSRAIDPKDSENEVVDSILEFSSTMNLFLEQQYVSLRARVTADKSNEKEIKIMEQKINRALRNPAMCTTIGHIQGSSSLQSGLSRIFIALEKFSASTVHGYEELLLSFDD